MASSRRSSDCKLLMLLPAVSTHRIESCALCRAPTGRRQLLAGWASSLLVRLEGAGMWNMPCPTQQAACAQLSTLPTQLSASAVGNLNSSGSDRAYQQGGGCSRLALHPRWAGQGGRSDCHTLQRTVSLHTVVTTVPHQLLQKTTSSRKVTARSPCSGTGSLSEQLPACTTT